MNIQSIDGRFGSLLKELSYYNAATEVLHDSSKLLYQSHFL
jgi:hypothetical protein